MISEPLFEQNISDKMFFYLDRYLLFDNWFLKYVGVLFLLYLCYKLLTYKNLVSYPHFLPDKTYHFSGHDKPAFFGLGFLLICFFVYAFSLYLNETSFFNNYDTMAHNTTRIFQQGITPFWGVNGRLSPMAFFDINIIYAVTHNFKLINVYILLQTVVIICLLNSFFDFMPAAKRFVATGLLILSPAFFWNNSVSYPEKMLLIYILSSLIFFKKYAANAKKSSNLWFAILFMNLAIYTKETTILLYFGLLVYAFLLHLWHEKITLSSFLHPVKTARTFPLEILIFLSVLIYAWFYLQKVYAILDSPYLALREATVSDAFKKYFFEIIVITLALIFALKNLSKNNLSFLGGGLILGSAFIIAMVVFYLKLTTFSSQLFGKTYYVVLPYMICLFYLAYALKNKAWLYVSVFICAFVLFADSKIAFREEGKSYREVAEFLIGQNNQPLNVFIAEKSEPAQWWYGCWASVYKYYWPKHKIQFKTSALNPEDMTSAVFLARWNMEKNLFHPISYETTPEANDFYVIKKTSFYDEDKKPLQNIYHKKVFENKLFEVYKIK